MTTRLTLSVPSLGDVTELLADIPESDSKLTITFTADGHSADIFLDLTGISVASYPVKGAKFTLTLPNGQQKVFVARKISKAYERYADPTIGLWTHKFSCVDPVTALANRKLPTRVSYVNTTAGAIFADLISTLDPSLNTSGITAGNPVSSFNLLEFSNFGDVLKSELISGGYIIRMGDGLNVEGKFETAFSTTEFRVDFNDYRYTPLRQDIEPPDEQIDSVRVIPTKQIPLFRVIEYHEQDGRVMPSVNLYGKPFGLDDAEPLRLSAGVDVNDNTTFIKTGSVSTGPTHILLNGGTLTMLEARPFVFPFIIDWVGIRAVSGGASFRIGFTDSSGAWLIYLDAADFGGVIQDTQFLQHVYSGYTAPQPDGSIAVWGLHLFQDFQASTLTALGTITGISGNDVTLDTAWTVGTDFIRITNPSGATERGRAQILRRSQDGKTLTLSGIPPGSVIGDKVFRGVSADQTLTISLVRTVSPSVSYGLPTLQGSGVAIEAFNVQRIGQISGKLLSESNPNPNSIYPRDLQLEVDVGESLRDGQISGSGSSGVVTWSRKFTTASRFEVVFNYVVGGKGKFESLCGSPTGDHITVTVDNEQDPDVLQAIANRICAVGNIPLPTVHVPIESTETTTAPIPHSKLPVVLPPEYRLANADIPIEEMTLQYLGGDDNTDIVMYEITAGNKSAADRIKDEALRGQGLTKYPIRVATISGAMIVDANWDDNILTATVSGGTVYGPHGEVLNLATGINPAEVMGIADPAAAPVTVYASVQVPGRTMPDIAVFQVIYPPAGVDASTLISRIHIKSRLAEWMWFPASGALKYNIYRKKVGATGETDADLELIDTVVAPASSWLGPIAKDNRSIWVQSVGLCDKVSSKIKLTVVPTRLSAPTVAFLKLKDDNRTKFLTTDPPDEALDIMYVTAPYNTGFTVTNGIPIPISSDPNAGLFHIETSNLNTDPVHKNHYTAHYDSTKAGQDFFLTVAWRNFFEEPQDWSTPINPNALKSARPEKPPTPRLADLEINEPNLETVEADANIAIRVHADQNYLSIPQQDWITFDQANARGFQVWLRRVKAKNRTPNTPSGGDGTWTNPGNALKSDDLRAIAPGGAGTLFAAVIINGVITGGVPSTVITGEADQIYVFGGPGDFWGNTIAVFTTAAFNSNAGVGVVFNWTGAEQRFFFPSFNVTSTGTIHGFMVKIECRVVAGNLEVDYVEGTAYFSRTVEKVVETIGEANFADDTTAFLKEVPVLGSVKFGSIYWVEKYLSINGKLSTPSDSSLANVVFQAGSQTGGLTPTITSVTAIDGDQQIFRATIQFTQIDPPVPVDMIKLKRKKGSSGRYKKIGDFLDIFGQDEYLASGLREVFIDFQTIDGVTDYSLIAILTTIQGIDRQSTAFPFSSTKKPVADAAPPQTPVLKRAFFKKAKSIIVVVDQPSGDLSNVTDYGFSFFFPQGAPVGSRTYFNPDTGATIGSPTFGRSGNAEFFSGGSKRFHADILRVELPAGAISGGVGVLCRAYNHILDVSGTVIESTSASGYPNITQIGSITSIGTDPTVQDSAAPGSVQNLTLLYSNKKGHKAKYQEPATNWLSGQGYFVSYFNDTAGVQWMSLGLVSGVQFAVEGQVSSPNSEAAAEIFVTDTHHTTHLKLNQYAAQFQATGLKVKVTPVNIVSDVRTRSASPVQSPVLVPASESDAAPGDSGPPGQPPPPIVQENYGKFFVEAVLPATNANALTEWQVVMSESGTAPVGDPVVGVSGVVKIKGGPAPTPFKRKTTAAVTVFFYTRCRNSFTTTWSAYSLPTSVTGSTILRPLVDVIGTDVITLPITGDNGFTNVNQTGVQGLTPMVVSLDTDTNELVIQFINPVGDPNGFSLTDIEVQIAKKGNGTVKIDQAIKAADGATMRVPYPSGYTPSIRCRYKNLFRDAAFVYTDPGADKAKGWSAWSKYVVDFQHTISSATGITPQGGDFQGPNSYPNPYPGY